MTAAELAERLERGERLAVLDVREPRERAYCAIVVPPASADLHVPMAQVPDRLDAIRAAAAGATLVVYCHHGVRSQMVADWLTAQGISGVANLDGGIDDWSRTVDPVVPRY
jgi:rhodanese-related sulfurtransferase